MMTGTDLLTTLRALGVSQKDFAKRIGYDKATISRYVRGHLEIPPVVELAVAGLERLEQTELLALPKNEAA